MKWILRSLFGFTCFLHQSKEQEGMISTPTTHMLYLMGALTKLYCINLHLQMKTIIECLVCIRWALYLHGVRAWMCTCVCKTLLNNSCNNPIVALPSIYKSTNEKTGSGRLNAMLKDIYWEILNQDKNLKSPTPRPKPLNSTLNETGIIFSSYSWKC